MFALVVRLCGTCDAVHISRKDTRERYCSVILDDRLESRLPQTHESRKLVNINLAIMENETAGIATAHLLHICRYITYKYKNN